MKDGGTVNGFLDKTLGIFMKCDCMEIVLGIPCSFTILENLSNTTKIESLPRLDLGNQSIKTSIQGALGIGNGV